MNRFKLWLAATVVAALGVVGFASLQAGAWSPAMAGSDNVVVKSGEVHKGSLYAAGEKVRVDGKVEGDLYCGAGSVVVAGEVTGDVVCAAQNLTVEGKVGQDARLAGQVVEVFGEVGGSLSVMAQNFTSSSDLQVGGDVNGMTQTANINGQVDGGVVMFSQSLNINGPVAGDLDLNVVSLRLGSKGEIAGSVNYQAPDELTIDKNMVAGEVNYLGTGEESTSSSEGGLFSGLAIVLMMFAATAFVLAALAPRFMERSSRILGKQPLNTVLLGFAAVFALPIISVLMMFTIVMLPLAFVLLMLWVVVLVLSGSFAAYYLGAVLLKGKPNILLRMIGGVLVLSILMLIPLVNILVFFASLIVGSGMLVATATHGYRRPSYQAEPAKKKLAKK